MATSTSEGTHDSLPVREAARSSGLSADVIRAWERRYGAISPLRGPRGTRLYRTDDIARLRLLGEAVRMGRRIGDVARLSTRQLEILATRDRSRARTPKEATPSAAAAHPAATRIFAALQRFDAAELERELGESFAGLGARVFVRDVARPLLERIGDCWEQGTVSIAAEHLATSSLRNLLAAAIQAQRISRGPRLMLATPSGERHDLGLLMVALLALQRGFNVYLLGADLPAADIVVAAARCDVRIVGVGMAARDNRKQAAGEIRTLARELPARVQLWLGGAEAAAVAKLARSPRPTIVASLDLLEEEIDGELRAHRSGGGD